MLRPEERRLALLAAGVRAAVLLLTTALDASLPDYDTSKYITPGSTAFAVVSYPALDTPYAQAAPSNHTAGLPLLVGATLDSPAAAGARAGSSPALLQGWLVWDSVFFADIAARGYVFEQYYAFFPLLPALASLAPAWLFALSALALSATASVAGALLLYRLGESVTGDRQLSALACLFFVLNPATIFHAAAYTESGFAAATLAALYCLHCRGRLAPAVAAVAVSCGLRSNGVVNAGYLGHFCLRRAAAAWPSSKVRALGQALLGVAAAAVAVSPLAAFQYAAYDTFCRFGGATDPAAASSGARVASAAGAGAGGAWPRPWCSSRVPYVYGFVQAEYWNVGFLRYWTLQQAPNFLLAAPALMLSVAGLAEYCRANGRHVLLHLGLTPLHLLPSEEPRGAAAPPGGRAAKHAAAGHEGGRESDGRAAEPRAGDIIPAGPVEGTGLRQRRAGAARGDVGDAGGGLGKPTHGSQGAGSEPLASGKAESVRERGDLGAALTATAAAAGGSGGGYGAGAGSGAGGGYLHPDLAVFMYPWAFSLAVAVTAMHVQVATRFLLSACPPLYWYMAHVWLRAAGDGGQGTGGLRTPTSSSSSTRGSGQADGSDGGRGAGGQERGNQGLDAKGGESSGGRGEERGGKAAWGRSREEGARSRGGGRPEDAGAGLGVAGTGRRGAEGGCGGTMGWCAVALWRWCLSYMMLGCVLFINFYPWT